VTPLKAQVNRPESWKRVIDVEIPREEFEGAFNEKLSDYRKSARLPGFRPGKAPAAMIAGRYGDVIKAEVIEKLVQSSFEAACKDNNIMPVSKALVSNLSAENGRPLTFSVETEVEPEIEIKGYHKLKVKITPQKVKPADVDTVVEDLRNRFAAFSDVERESKKGDYITIEYTRVVVDGEERKDLKNPQYPIELGSSALKDFDKGLFGRRAGETAELSVKFPKDYGDQALAGKQAEITVAVKKVQEKNLPEINSDFLKKAGDFESIAALRERIQADLEQREYQKARNDAYNKTIDILIKDNPFEVPPSKVERYIDYMCEDLSRYVRPGEPLPAREEVGARYRESGVRTLKRHRIIAHIAAKEGIRATQEEVDKEIARIAAQYNQPFEKVKEALRKDATVLRIREDIAERKTLDFLIGEYTPEKENADTAS
jgi:trigger factor